MLSLYQVDEKFAEFSTNRKCTLIEKSANSKVLRVLESFFGINTFQVRKTSTDAINNSVSGVYFFEFLQFSFISLLFPVS